MGDWSGRACGLNATTRPFFNVNAYCVYCKKIADESVFFNTIRCRKCENRKQRKRSEVKSRKVIEQACKDLTESINSSKADLRDIPAIVDAFKRRVGGVENLANMLADDFLRVRGDHLTDEEKKEFHFKEQVIQRYHQMLMKSMKENDDSKVADMSSLSDEELKSILGTVAMDIIEGDKDFRLKLVREVIRENPDLLNQVDGRTIKDEEKTERITDERDIEPHQEGFGETERAERG